MKVKFVNWWFYLKIVKEFICNFNWRIYNIRRSIISRMFWKKDYSLILWGNIVLQVNGKFLLFRIFRWLSRLLIFIKIRLILFRISKSKKRNWINYLINNFRIAITIAPLYIPIITKILTNNIKTFFKFVF